MESLYLLIPVSLLLVTIAAAAFFWAVNSGQYDDIDREGERLLFEDELEEADPDREDDSAPGSEGDNRD